LLIFNHLNRAFTVFHRRWNNFLCKSAVLLRLPGAIEAFDCIGILLLAGELVMGRRVLGEGSHQPTPVIGIFQTIQEHVIDDLRMAETHTAPRLWQQIGRVRHTLHSAGDHDIRRASGDQVMSQHRRLHAGPTHLVDGCAACCLRNACTQTCLSGWGLALTGRQHVAEDDFFNVISRQIGTVQGTFDRHCAKLGSGRVFQIPLKPAHGSSRSGDDDNGVFCSHFLRVS